MVRMLGHMSRASKHTAWDTLGTLDTKAAHSEEPGVAESGWTGLGKFMGSASSHGVCSHHQCACEPCTARLLWRRWLTAPCGSNTNAADQMTLQQSRTPSHARIPGAGSAKANTHTHRSKDCNAFSPDYKRLELFNGNNLGQAERALMGRIGQPRTKNPESRQPTPLHSPALKAADWTPFQGTHHRLAAPMRLSHYSSKRTGFPPLCTGVSSLGGPRLAQVQNCFVDLRVCPVVPNVIQVIIKIHKCFIGTAVQE